MGGGHEGLVIGGGAREVVVGGLDRAAGAWGQWVHGGSKSDRQEEMG